ncbi:cell division protein DivIVA [Mycobacterium paraterrae]|uniref:Cell division protein DivIVA n=1 Tax=Mycobacterium paraterrae TaxID=577492 RepID=A0ABY3VKB5_9MYCO|nr:cell division protein DivIVA [Mycobacterium paraterrae]UMB67883.1 cell division protein DivIVA [Mycobacterium paraterrae]
MTTETAQTFSRILWGYNPAAVDARIEVLTTKQQFLLNDVESLRARLRDAGDEAAALRKEIAVLTDTSSSPHALQQRMAKMLRQAVDEIAEMQAEAQSEADALVAAAEAEADAVQAKHRDELIELAAQKKALEAEYAETKAALEAEVATMRADAERQREQLLADAKREADDYRDEVKRAVDEASRQRLKVLEQLMGVYRDLEAVPAALESAYEEVKNHSEASTVGSGDSAR